MELRCTGCVHVGSIGGPCSSCKRHLRSDAVSGVYIGYSDHYKDGHIPGRSSVQEKPYVSRDGLICRGCVRCGGELWSQCKTCSRLIDTAGVYKGVKTDNYHSESGCPDDIRVSEVEKVKGELVGMIRELRDLFQRTDKKVEGMYKEYSQDKELALEKKMTMARYDNEGRSIFNSICGLIDSALDVEKNKARRIVYLQLKERAKQLKNSL